MRDHMLKTGFALLAAAFVAVPLSVSADETMTFTYSARKKEPKCIAEYSV